MGVGSTGGGPAGAGGGVFFFLEEEDFDFEFFFGAMVATVETLFLCFLVGRTRLLLQRVLLVDTEETEWLEELLVQTGDIVGAGRRRERDVTDFENNLWLLLFFRLGTEFSGF